MAAIVKDDDILTDEQTALKINNMINKNKLADLKRFFSKRQNLNISNQWFGYLFYLLQTASVFSTSLGQSYTNEYLIWTGIGLTSFGTLIHAIINSNTKINNNLMKNIKDIKQGSYIDESNIDGLDEKKSIHDNGTGISGTGISGTGTSNNTVISIDALKESVTNTIIDNATGTSSIV
jgi:hypothetical protein